MLTIQYEKRQIAGRLDNLRSKGSLPAVFYGPKEASTPITIKSLDFKKIWSEAGESSIIILKDASGEEHEALIHDVDVHPVTGAPRHADFYVIEKGKKLQLGVSLEFTGVAPAVKDAGGTLVKVLHEVEIEALPKDLPHHIVVDISALVSVDSQILAKDLPLPAGVELITNPEEVVAAIAVAKEEPEDAPAATIDDIEVVGAKGKEAVEGEGDADAEKSDK
jgi:large subunit ribosomal protein L25